jgi:type VI secretion system secreted protein VgrG
MSLISLTLGCGEPLQVHRFSVKEAVSSLFTVKVVASSADACLDFGAILGQPAMLRVSQGDGGRVIGERVWSGLCSEIGQRQALEIRAGEAGASTVELTIVPWLWQLTRRTDYRVFQHLAGHEIARTLLEEWSIEADWQLDPAEHPRLAYKVQYGESDFAFFSRILEEAGIAYTFLGDEDASQLVLSDGLEGSAPRRWALVAYVDSPMAASWEKEYVTHVRVEQRLRCESVTIRDHDFLRPAWPLRGEVQACVGKPTLSERHVYQPGASVVEGMGPGEPCHEDRQAERLARRLLQGERSGEVEVSFRSNTIELKPGTIFAVEGHARRELDPRAGLLVTEQLIEGGPRGEWKVEGKAVRAEVAYRPQRRTPKPAVHGVQSGVVVGPAEQEIHADEHGRVRVQFPWDRRGRSDEQSSCWLRVAQGWSGAGYGIFALPRIGQEVLVAFLAGDPDQPVVVGRLSNALNPMPVKLPAEQTQSVWRSSSSPGGGGFNEIRFEDRSGAEWVSVRAERQLNTLVGLDEELAVRRNRVKAVGGDESARTEGRAITYVGSDAHLTVEEELRERIGGKHSVTVEGDRHEHVGGALLVETGGAIHLKAGRALVLEAGDITLRGAGGFVRIDGSGVTLDGGGVKILQGGVPGGAPSPSPASPLLPAGVSLRSEPRRLPLLSFASGLPPMQAGGLGGGGGGGRPLMPEELVVCGFICRCKEESLAQRCVTQHIRAMEDASGHTSPIKAEVPYDMSTKPPTPIMSKNDPRRPTRSWPAGSKIPDVVVVKDGTRPPTQDNLKAVIEIKFPPDQMDKQQRESYRKIAREVPLKELGPDECGCPGRRQQRTQAQDMTVQDWGEIVALTLLVLATVLDDAIPGGQADDVVIPPAIARMLTRLAPLLR